MKEFLLVSVMSMLLFSSPGWAEQEAKAPAAEKARETDSAAETSPGKAAAKDAVKEEKPFVDRDGDGIRDGQEHRFRKQKRGQQDQDGEDETTGNRKRKRNMQGQPSGGGQNRQGQ
ncbi:MAG: hypothetical protein WC889_17495 [Myxococcota bacterium]|jgi:hypothetical protein